LIARAILYALAYPEASEASERTYCKMQQSSGDLRASNISRARLIVRKAPDLVEQDQ
jgi:hypothetical protein